MIFHKFVIDGLKKINKGCSISEKTCIGILKIKTCIGILRETSIFIFYHPFSVFERRVECRLTKGVNINYQKEKRKESAFETDQWELSDCILLFPS